MIIVTDDAVRAALKQAGERGLFLTRSNARYLLEAAAPHLEVSDPQRKPLPTKPGTVIYVSNINGAPYDPPLMAVLTGDGDAFPWFIPLASSGDAQRWLGENEIDAWHPATVTPGRTEEDS